MFKVSPASRQDVEVGGKVLLPSSALHDLTLRNIEYPLTFSLESQRTGKKTHAGVLEFIAPEGRVILPRWVRTRFTF